MTHAQFDVILRDRLDKIGYILSSKAQEYASDTDRLSNFKKAALFMGSTPEEALMGFLTKHLVSIFDMVKLEAKGVSSPLAVWQEKIGDAINYLILLEALVGEFRVQVNTVYADGNEQ